MKHFKAIVIDGKKLVKRLAGFCLLAVFFFLFLEHSNLTPNAVINELLPALSASEDVLQEKVDLFQRGIKRLSHSFFSWESFSPIGILSSQLPAMAQVAKEPLLTLSQAQTIPSPSPSSTPAPILKENQAPIKAVDLSPNKSGSKRVQLGNQTGYTIDIDAMLDTALSFDLSKNQPKILIIHTHATESYSPDGSQVYDTTSGDRSQNREENMVHIGKVMADYLNQQGIKTIHDTDLHDSPSFNGSYAHSLSAIESYLKTYPSIQMVLDLHRDSIVYEDNTKAKPVTEINGKPAAQLMFVVGTDEKGLSHPNWRKNLTWAIQLQNAINQKYPKLMRHINLRQERFNGHTTQASLIIEVGSSGNTLSEAEYSILLAAEVLADFLKM